MTAASLLCLALFGGCASAAQRDGQWVKPEASAEQLERDRAECVMRATKAVPGRTTGRAYDTDRFERCMAERGYQRAPVR